jgi:hypothetical protein
LNSGPTPWATPPALFCDGVFQARVLRTICPIWLPTVILLISATWVARITSVWSFPKYVFFSSTLHSLLKHKFVNKWII